jgi:hypothetical protein
LKNNWFWLPAGITALALELLGYFSARLILSVWEHNRTLSATEKNLTVSVWRAWLPVGAYVAIALYLTVFVEFVPAAFLGSYLAFPFIGLLSAWVTAEYRVLENHTAEKNDAREKAREAAQKARDEKKQAAAKLAQETAQAAQVAPQPAPQVAKPAPPAFTRDNLLAQYLANPYATLAHLAQVFGKSHTAVGDLRNKMIAEHIIWADGKEIKPVINYTVADASPLAGGNAR